MSEKRGTYTLEEGGEGGRPVESPARYITNHFYLFINVTYKSWLRPLILRESGALNFRIGKCSVLTHTKASDYGHLYIHLQWALLAISTDIAEHAHQHWLLDQTLWWYITLKYRHLSYPRWGLKAIQRFLQWSKTSHFQRGGLRQCGQKLGEGRPRWQRSPQTRYISNIVINGRACPSQWRR